MMKKQMLKRCPDHEACYNKCEHCGHCDTSYLEDNNLQCDCKKCECEGEEWYSKA